MRKLQILLLVGCLLSTQWLLAQVPVTGKVTDEKGAALPGVTVSVKNKRGSVVTDENGSFQISAPQNSTLVFSYTGYQNLERVVNGSSVNVSLQPGDNTMSEVVVTGYTAQTRRALTGSITKIRADEVRLQPLASFEQQLQGKSAGLLIQSASGQPGSAASVTIRGKGSILGSTQPLYIVDGIQISAADFQSMNPSDFESYNILKDAVATAQYGSRGANGVIVITTKRGVSGKTRLTYDYQHGIGRLPENTLKLMNSAQKIAFELSADGIYGTNPNGWSQADADSLAKVEDDYEKSFFRKAITNQHQLSLSGGNERTRFFVSGSVFKQQGEVIATGLDRYSGRINIDHNAGDFKLSLNTYVGSSIFTNTSENNTGIGSPLNAIRWHLPYVTAYLPDGSYNDADMAIQGQPNPFRELIENPRSNKQLKGVGSASLEYSAPFLKGLTARTNWGVDYTENMNRRYINRTTYLGSQQVGGQGAFAESFSRNTRYTGTTSIGYRKQLDNQGFNISLFHEVVDRDFNSFGYTGYGLVGPLKNGAGITPGTPTNGYIPAVNSNESELAIVSFFGIGEYNFKNKYFLNGNVRRDGSSKLAEGKKWATYGAIGGGWLVSSEKFLANSRVINDLKLKVSYGSAANQNVGGDYEALEQFGTTSYNGVGGLALVNFKKQNLTWERRTTLNAGLDFGLLKNRISGTVEVYNSTTNNLYLDRQLSGTNGAYTILTNMGKMRNRGIEATLNFAVVKSAGFNWDVTLNHTYNQNKILALSGEPENIDGLFINRVGEPQNSIYVVRFAGVDPNTGNSLYLTKDGKTTDQYDPNDRVIVGTVDPPHFGGFTNTFGYKGLELSVLFSYMFGNKIYNNDRTNVENPAYYYSSAAESLLRAWKQPGDVTDVPSLLEDYHPETTRYVENGSFIRLRNVMVSYNLPASVAGHIRSSGIRLYVQGQNLKTWHHIQGYDPEGHDNLVGSVYPPLKTITFGITAGF